MKPERTHWKCCKCERPGCCEICESCSQHCEADEPNDLAAHRRLDYVIASTDPARKPN